ncbi:hypothetical protein BA059_16690 [Mycolicibacterium sp. (ex Dasyatis americana)]|nr:hypothetical protein BA059_16690 [Mycolicibacterium sp. (ex Dasyatis americana)]
MQSTEYSYEIREDGAALMAFVVAPDGRETVTGRCMAAIDDQWVVSLVDDQGSTASAVTLDRADALTLMDFHAGLLVRLMAAEAVQP